MPAVDDKNNQKAKQKEAERLEDHACPICMYVLIEPVTLPCEHELCLSCFQQNVHESLCCPMCRCRISSWVRRQARLNNLVNQERWKQIKTLFPEKVRLRQEGRDDDEEEKESHANHRLAEPGEIRQEYERALQKLAEERDAEQRREEEASAALLKTLEEEDKRVKEELEKQESQLKRDEELARFLETAGSPRMLRRKIEEEAKDNNPNDEVSSQITRNGSPDLSPNNDSSSSPATLASGHQKRKASPSTTDQSKHPRLIQITSRQPIHQNSVDHVCSPSSISGNGINHSQKKKLKINIVDHFEKLKFLQTVDQLSPKKSCSPPPTKTEDTSILNGKADQLFHMDSEIHSSPNIVTAASNKLGRKILFEKKLNVDKCNSKSGPSTLVSRMKGSPKASLNGKNKMEMYFKQKEKSVCATYKTDEASQSLEEKDRLFALALQKQYDMEIRMSRQVNRAKGTSDEYKLRQKHEEKNKEATVKARKSSRDQKKFKS